MLMIDKEASAEKTTAIRIATLARISGLTVTCQRQGNTRAFIFAHPTEPGRVLKTVFLYRRARIFAEAVAIGRRLAKPAKLSESLREALFLAGRRILENLRKFRIPI